MKDAPSNAVETTLSFLKSENGVRQALYVQYLSLASLFLFIHRTNHPSGKTRYMGADEVRTITTDKWDDDIWGTSTAGKPPYRLVFYFGRKDHWVAERTRDDIIKSRGSSKDGPTMIVCEDNIPHAFCIRKFMLPFFSWCYALRLWLSSQGCGEVMLMWFGFIGHNTIMARKVAQFIEDIMLE